MCFTASFYSCRVVTPAGRRTALLAAWVCLFAFWSGCGDGGGRYPGVSLEGVVTIDGQPLADGWIMFLPQQPGCGGGVKAEIKNGRYSAQQVPLGKVLVTFNAMQETGRMVESPSSPGKPLPERIDLVPAQYRSGVTLEVKGDVNIKDFVL